VIGIVRDLWQAATAALREVLERRGPSPGDGRQSQNRSAIHWVPRAGKPVSACAMVSPFAWIRDGREFDQVDDHTACGACRAARRRRPA